MKKIILFILSIIALMAIIQPGKTSAENASEGASVLEKIKEKVEAIRSSPKAYIGTITDKTENSLQIKDIEGKIQQISIKDGVSIVKTGKVNTDVKFTDVAIGDYIVAMGLESGNSVLEAKRILLTTPLEEPQRKIVFGNISKIQNKEITVSDSNGAESIFTFPKKWKGPEIKELQEGTKVLVVSAQESGKIFLRTIEIINTTPSPADSGN